MGVLCRRGLWSRFSLGVGSQLWFPPLWVALALAAPQAAQQRNPDFRLLRSPGVSRERPLREPRFVVAAQAAFLKDTDPVMGVSGNGVAKAYQPPIVAWHHIIEDKLGDLPILATW